MLFSLAELLQKNLPALPEEESTTRISEVSVTLATFSKVSNQLQMFLRTEINVVSFSLMTRTKTSLFGKMKTNAHFMKFILT